MLSDSYIEEHLDNGTLKPAAGSLWCEKYTPGKASIEVEGFGIVDFDDCTESGLILVSNTTKETDAVKASLFIVRAVGSEPANWSSRWTNKTQIWDNPERGDRVWPTSFGQQHVNVGTVVAIRAEAGLNQGKTSRFMQIRYDELIAIGNDEEFGPDMYPAPGFVLIDVDVDDEELDTGLYKGAGTVYANGWVLWGTVIALPRDYDSSEGFVEGDRVAIPMHYGVGATEYIEFNGHIRCMPMDDLLCVLS